MVKKLIITGDDFGYTHNINLGMIELYELGMLTDFSLLANAPGSLEAAEYLKKHPKVPAGLHFNITRFRPISNPEDVKSLIDKNGEFYRPEVHKQWNFSFLEKVKEEDIEKELEAQVQWFIKQVGRMPDHLIPHKCESGDPKVLLPLAKVLKKYNLPTRAPLWRWKENYGALSFLDCEKIKYTDKVYIIGTWAGTTTDLINNFKAIYPSFGKVTELVAMPGYVGADEISISDYSWERAQVMEILLSEKVKEFLKSNKVKLVSYQNAWK